MVKARACGFVGVFSVIAISSLVLPACGEVIAADAEQTQLCAKKSCHGKNCPKPDPDGAKGTGGDGSGGDCANGKGGAGGTAGSVGGAGGTGLTGPDSTTPTDVLGPTCSVCRRAENCCKAEGHTDCGYTAACAAATNAQQMDYYLVQCRLVLEAASAGGKTTPDVCGLY